MYERLDMDKNEWIFMEDNDAKHTSKYSKNWKEKEEIKLAALLTRSQSN